MTITALPARPIGRPCAVCSLPTPERVHLEVSLARGVSISRLARGGTGAPSKDSIRRHVLSGHLPAELQDEILRATGLDSTTIIGRIYDVAQRAREAALDARDRSNYSAVTRAGDAELRALSALTALGATSEHDIELQRDAAAIARAVLTVAKRNTALAEAVAAELSKIDFPELAAEVLNLGSVTPAQSPPNHLLRNEIAP